ncbi:hypothetical protein TWF225_000982 [Orbilia oligospora]|uniref:Uncharacterized protein n=1 Tax=Orbilia oligospora TaxID=2813651 RepID=A0A8H2DXJ0_ORBOL|nr:hypothetical protein TWF225_000982 [Orbilia oligospora]KAF3266837.1 hypothetical protein TWF217_000927 [Orbilia oligospora]KAF3273643.1 hypothetical protein TWF132_004825 [Orbilia oligospora]TGJ66702.1 hypothetical protein EYR41_008310 [Orbilia oligospora]
MMGRENKNENENENKNKNPERTRAEPDQGWAVGWIGLDWAASWLCSWPAETGTRTAKDKRSIESNRIVRADIIHFDSPV